MSIGRVSLLLKRVVGISMVVVLGMGMTQAQTKFNHPGIPFNTEDLARMKKNVKKEPWKSGYEKLLKDRRSSLDYKMQGPLEFVNREPNVGMNEFNSDSTAVLHQSILYSVTGNEQYADNALKIIRAWTKEHKEWGGGTVFLAASDHGLYFIQGAEILRYTYKKWTASDTRLMETYCEEMLWPLFHHPKPLRAANQGAAQLKGGMAVAVFLNDKEKFKQVIDAYRADPSAGILNTLPNGQTGDSGRDQGHAFGMLKNLAFTAEVAYRQNVDLYSLLDDRLLTVSEYWSKYNLGEEVAPWIPYGTAYGYYTTIGERGRKSNVGYATGYLEQIYGAYTVRNKKKSPFLKKMRDVQEPNVDTFLYRKDKDTSRANVKVYVIKDHTVSKRFSPKEVNLGSVAEGSSEYDRKSGVWSISGAGDVYGGGDSDRGFFQLQEMNKDATIVARVLSVGESKRLSKAGIVFRESEESASNMLAVFGDGNDNASSTWRGGSERGVSQDFKEMSLPIWVKLEKKWNRVNAYTSPDGKHWTPIRSCLFSPTKKYYFGLFSTSNSNDELATAKIDNVKILTVK